jgi:hypothetical protein
MKKQSWPFPFLKHIALGPSRVISLKSFSPLSLPFADTLIAICFTALFPPAVPLASVWRLKITMRLNFTLCPKSIVITGGGLYRALTQVVAGSPSMIKPAFSMDSPGLVFTILAELNRFFPQD